MLSLYAKNALMNASLALLGKTAYRTTHYVKGMVWGPLILSKHLFSKFTPMFIISVIFDKDIDVMQV